VINAATRAFVIARAGNRCEFCRLPQAGYEATFHIDHAVALQHRRDDDAANLALACPKCNRKKGPNLSGIDPLTQTVVVLFNPRNDGWTTHFRWDGSRVVGLTPTGRATVALLDLNDEDRLRLRLNLISEGGFGPVVA
jgi:hypothetical protein